MLDLSNISLRQLAIHFVGNKHQDESLYLSTNTFNSFAESIELDFVQFFTSPFQKVAEFYNFYHATELGFNEVNAFCNSFFSGKMLFPEVAEKLAITLFEKSNHPNISGGELFIASFTGTSFNGESVDALGIFKSEQKDTFIKLNKADGGYQYELDKGININEMDKGCIVLNTPGAGKLTVCVLDNTNKSKEAKFWTDDFLTLINCQDEFHFTKDYLDVARQFVTDRMPEVFELSKADKIDYLNKSINYFKKNNHFAEEDFLQDVFQHGEVIEKFNEFKDQYSATHELNLDNSFEISNQAVKQQARVFKSILKLDKNFHIYIHGNKELIERGTDPDGRKFYKIYYEREA